MAYNKHLSIDLYEDKRILALQPEPAFILLSFASPRTWHSDIYDHLASVPRLQQPSPGCVMGLKSWVSRIIADRKSCFRDSRILLHIRQLEENPGMSIMDPHGDASTLEAGRNSEWIVHVS